MSSVTFDLRDVDKTKIALAGGKAANLGELTKIEGINVPEGFCISTEANNQVSAELEKEITDHLERLGPNAAYAVRSSATAEDLPTASFAGQYDTYLNITGKAEILKHIRKCWASLDTERAIAYREQNNIDDAQIAVIVQKMVNAKVSGIMFTADPITANRKITSIDATPGLGEALVSGRVNADTCKVHNNKIERVDPTKQTVTDQQIVQLEQIGRKIEEHFGSPQDIEWCLADNKIYIVQSRPITTLYPIPEASDKDYHVYVSVGHQQMMTDPMKPLGISFWQLTAGRPMHVAGGRLFVDVAANLVSVVNILGKSDPLIKDALTTIIERGGQTSTIPQQSLPAIFGSQIDYDPTLVPELINKTQRSIEELKQNIQHRTGTDLLEFIKEDIQTLKQILFDPQSAAVFMTAMNASSWINEKIAEWLGEKNVADILTLSVQNNITSEMGLALMDVADEIRPYPEVVEYLEHTTKDNFLQVLPILDGGQEAREVIMAWLDKYGMRGVGEIDITRTRWSEKPLMLVPIILGNIRNFEPGASELKFNQGFLQAHQKEQEVLTRLRQLPDGEQKAAETKKKIDLVRNYIGYREYPKYGKISRYFIYKQALLREADQLATANVIHNREDIYYLTLDELQEVISSRQADYLLINQRKAEYNHYKKLTPPRVMTSEGEIITGSYKRTDLPPNSLIGLPVSSGVIEGRARVILNMEDATNLEPGDILVTPFTDPSWTPLFVQISGLITEVGGLMTHGAVIAREYGLPAVVGVENASKLIKDGQYIRINGTEGYIVALVPAL